MSWTAGQQDSRAHLLLCRPWDAGDEFVAHNMQRMVNMQRLVKRTKADRPDSALMPVHTRGVGRVVAHGPKVTVEERNSR